MMLWLNADHFCKAERTATDQNFRLSEKLPALAKKLLMAGERLRPASLRIAWPKAVH